MPLYLPAKDCCRRIIYEDFGAGREDEVTGTRAYSSCNPFQVNREIPRTEWKNYMSIFR